MRSSTNSVPYHWGSGIQDFKVSTLDVPPPGCVSVPPEAGEETSVVDFFVSRIIPLGTPFCSGPVCILPSFLIIKYVRYIKLSTHHTTSLMVNSIPSTTGNGRFLETRNKIHSSRTSSNSSRHTSSASALAYTP